MKFNIVLISLPCLKKSSFTHNSSWSISLSEYIQVSIHEKNMSEKTNLTVSVNVQSILVSRVEL